MGRELSRPAGWAEKPQLWVEREGEGEGKKQATGAARLGFRVGQVQVEGTPLVLLLAVSLP